MPLHGSFRARALERAISLKATAGMNDPIKLLQVLLSEGSSTSAREAITILGLSGHRVEICDPSPWCLGRYSRFVRKFHHCPALRDNPYGYLAFVEELLAQRHFDVLLPTHEQGFLFARVAERLRHHAGLALPSFASYRTAHGKAGFSRLLDALGLPQPSTRIVTSESELRAVMYFPAMIKTLGRHRQPRHLAGARRKRTRARGGRSQREPRLRGRGAGAGVRRGHDRKGAIGCFATAN